MHKLHLLTPSHTNFQQTPMHNSRTYTCIITESTLPPHAESLADDCNRFTVVERQLLSTASSEAIECTTVADHVWLHCWNQTVTGFQPRTGLTVDSSQLTFTSKLHDTKTKTNIKNPARSNLDIEPFFKNQWSVASSHCKWRRRQLLKMEGFPNFRGSWPWSWMRSYCILSCITHCSPPTCQISLKSKKRFVDRRTDRHLRPTLLRRLTRVDLITFQKACSRWTTWRSLEQFWQNTDLWPTDGRTQLQHSVA